jgi:hypothetical protein
MPMAMAMPMARRRRGRRRPMGGRRGGGGAHVSTFHSLLLLVHSAASHSSPAAPPAGNVDTSSRSPATRCSYGSAPARHPTSPCRTASPAPATAARAPVATTHCKTPAASCATKSARASPSLSRATSPSPSHWARGGSPAARAAMWMRIRSPSTRDCAASHSACRGRSFHLSRAGCTWQAHTNTHLGPGPCRVPGQPRAPASRRPGHRPGAGPWPRPRMHPLPSRARCSPPTPSHPPPSGPPAPRPPRQPAARTARPAGMAANPRGWEGQLIHQWGAAVTPGIRWRWPVPRPPGRAAANQRARGRGAPGPRRITAPATS